MKGLMKIFSGVLALLKEWGILEAAKEYTRGTAWEVVQWSDGKKVEWFQRMTELLVCVRRNSWGLARGMNP